MSREIVDDTVKDYLERAYSIRCSFGFGYSVQEAHTIDVEIAKMIQKEEHQRELIENIPTGVLETIALEIRAK